MYSQAISSIASGPPSENGRLTRLTDYRRTNLIDKRWALMDDWGRFAAADVRALVDVEHFKSVQPKRGRPNGSGKVKVAEAVA